MGKSILLSSLFIVCSTFTKAQFTAANLAVFCAKSATANNTNFSIAELNPSTVYQLSPVTTVTVLLSMLIQLFFNLSLSQKFY